jgi:hypothetical protein
MKRLYSYNHGQQRLGSDKRILGLSYQNVQTSKKALIFRLLGGGKLFLQ